MIEKQSATFAAGEVKSYMVQGRRFELRDVPYTCDVALLNRDGVKISEILAAETSDYVNPDNGPFYEFRITSPVAQTIKWTVGSGDSGNRKTAGVVSVVDGGRQRTLAQSAFAGVLTSGATAGQVSHVGLSNPANSGKNVIVKAYRVSIDAGAYVLVGMSATALTTDSGPLPSKLATGAASLAHKTSQLNATSLVTALSDQFILAPSSAIVVTLQEPIVLPPGFSLNLSPTAANCGIAVGVEFTEELV